MKILFTSISVILYFLMICTNNALLQTKEVQQTVTNSEIVENHYSTDQAIYTLAFSAAAISSSDTIETYIQRLDRFGALYESIENSGNSTRITFSNELYTMLNSDPIESATMNIDYQDLNISAPLYYSTPEDIDQLPFRNFDTINLSCSDIMQMITPKIGQLSLPIDKQNDTLSAFYLCMLEATSLFPGTEYDECLKVAKHFHEKVVTTDNKISVSAGLANSEIEIMTDLYFNSRKLSCVVITVFSAGNASYKIPYPNQSNDGFEDDLYIMPIVIIDIENTESYLNYRQQTFSN